MLFTIFDVPNVFSLSGRAVTAQMSTAPCTRLHFSVEAGAVRPWESVFVTGSAPALGAWIPANAFLLFPEPDTAFVLFSLQLHFLSGLETISSQITSH